MYQVQITLVAGRLMKRTWSQNIGSEKPWSIDIGYEDFGAALIVGSTIGDQYWSRADYGSIDVCCEWQWVNR